MEKTTVTKEKLTGMTIVSTILMLFSETMCLCNSFWWLILGIPSIILAIMCYTLITIRLLHVWEEKKKFNYGKDTPTVDTKN
jgi:hypothetical protein